MNDSLESITKVEVVNCEICFENFQNDIDLTEHNRHFHDPEHPARCRQCGMDFPNSTDFQRHIWTHLTNSNHSSQSDLSINSDVESDKNCKFEDSDNGEEENNSDTNSNNNEPNGMSEQPLYSCQFCVAVYKIPAHLLKHIRRIHNVDDKDNKFNCPLCPANEAKEHNFTSEIQVNRHIKEEHHIKKMKEEPNEDGASGSIFFCQFCGLPFSYRRSLYCHVRSKHKTTMFACKLCQRKFPASSLLKKHVLVHMTRTCGTCQLELASPSKLLRHMRTHTGERPFRCELCGKGFAGTNNLKHHMLWSHTKERSASCDICNKAFPEAGAVKRHQKQVHFKQRELQCEHCELIFTVESLYVEHLAEHENDSENVNGNTKERKRTKKKRKSEEKTDVDGTKKLRAARRRKDRHEKIESCSFDSDSNNVQPLENFLEVHFMTDAEEYSSKDGNKQVDGKRLNELDGKVEQESIKNRKEENSVEKDEKYSCKKCKITFTKVEQWERHRDAGRCFVCDQCSRVFKQAGNYARHLRQHAGEKPFACDQCDRAFFDSSHLKKHIVREHVGERHFCPDCGRGFYYVGNLNRHRVMHDTTKRYNCVVCQLEFVKSDELKAHTAKVHAS